MRDPDRLGETADEADQLRGARSTIRDCAPPVLPVR
jgi:hypothetical protein